MRIVNLHHGAFVNIFRKLGHDVLSIGTTPDCDVVLKQPLSYKRFLELLENRGMHPDLIFWCDACQTPWVFGIENMPCVTIGYSVDQYMNPWHVPFSAGFDAFFVAQKDYLPLFTASPTDRPATWMPLFCDPGHDQDAGMHGKRHRGVEPIDRARRGKDKMFDLMLAAIFQYIEISHHISIHVVFRVGQAVAHPGLGCQIDHMGKSAGVKHPVDSRPIRHIFLDEIKFCVGAEQGKTVFFQLHRVIGVQVVKPRHLKSHRQKSATQMEADEAGRAGNKNFHDSFG